MARIQITQAVAEGFPAARFASQVGSDVGLFPAPVTGRLVDVDVADDGSALTITVETPEDFDWLPTLEGLRRERSERHRHLRAITTDVEPDERDSEGR